MGYGKHLSVLVGLTVILVGVIGLPGKAATFEHYNESTTLTVACEAKDDVTGSVSLRLGDKWSNSTFQKYGGDDLERSITREGDHLSDTFAFHMRTSGNTTFLKGGGNGPPDAHVYADTVETSYCEPAAEPVTIERNRAATNVTIEWTISGSDSYSGTFCLDLDENGDLSSEECRILPSRDSGSYTETVTYDPVPQDAPLRLIFRDSQDVKEARVTGHWNYTHEDQGLETHLDEDNDGEEQVSDISLDFTRFTARDETTFKCNNLGIPSSQCPEPDSGSGPDEDGSGTSDQDEGLLPFQGGTLPFVIGGLLVLGAATGGVVYARPRKTGSLKQLGGPEDVNIPPDVTKGRGTYDLMLDHGEGDFTYLIFKPPSLGGPREGVALGVPDTDVTVYVRGEEFDDGDSHVLTETARIEAGDYEFEYRPSS